MPAPPAQMRIEGLAELRRELRRLSDASAYTREFRNAGKEAAGQIIPTAKAIAPRRSGRLANSLRALASGSTFAVAAGRAAVPYAGPIHFGHPARGIRAQPFIYEAAERREAEVLEAFLDALDKITARAFPGRS